MHRVLLCTECCCAPSVAVHRVLLCTECCCAQSVAVHCCLWFIHVHGVGCRLVYMHVVSMMIGQCLVKVAVCTCMYMSVVCVCLCSQKKADLCVLCLQWNGEHLRVLGEIETGMMESL